MTQPRMHRSLKQERAGFAAQDPVLCECMYTWFSPEGGRVLDPFAGGSVRGIVAACLGRQYTGIELSAEQVEANRKQAAENLKPGEPVPQWIVGDSRQLDTLLPDFDADFLFTCPPYFNLEVYSDNAVDVICNARDYAAFLEAYKQILHLALARLKPNRFACIVVGGIRRKEDGAVLSLAADTVGICEDNGAVFHNDAILLTPAGSLAIRAARMFYTTGKLGRTYQDVLIFCKGDPRKAIQAKRSACSPARAARS